MRETRCIICNTIIPEGKQICYECERNENSFKDFVDVITTVKEMMPKLTMVHSMCFIVDNNPDLQLRVSKPDPFSNYSDIIARVTLYYKEKSISDNLITIDTNLKRFCKKLSNKTKELMVLKGNWRKIK